MITLSTKWTGPNGITFPTGTVFIPQRTTRNRSKVYTYGTPGGGHGEVLLREGVIPGADSERG